MSDIATKLSYLNTTKSNLKDMINYGLDNDNKITNQTTFRNYVSSTFKAFIESLNNPNTLWGNLPKITGEGKEITLNNTIEAPMKLELKPSELEQGADPSPSNPQQIHTISGDNEIKVCNKNLFNIPSVSSPFISISYQKISENSISITTTSSNTQFRYIQIPLIVKPNTSYYFKANFTNSNSNITDLWLQIKDKVNNNILTNSVYANGSVKSFDTGDNKNIEVFLYVNGATEGLNTATWYNIQITTNSTDDFVPHKEQVKEINLGDIEYCEIGDYSDGFIRNSGKNFFDKDNATINTPYTLSNNVISTSRNTYTNGRVFLNPINVTTGYYTISFNVSLSGSNKRITVSVKDEDTNENLSYEFLNITDNNRYNQTIELNKLTNILICIQPYDDNSGTIYLTDIQLEYGSSASSFEPYGNGQWYIKKNIGKVVLDGSESWNYAGSATTPTNRTVIQRSSSITGQYYSNRFIYNDSSTSNRLIITGGTMYLSIDDSIVGIESGDSNDTKVQKIKTWLSTHNTIVYYILETPTYTLLNNTLQTQLEDIYNTIKSYNGQTLISQNNTDLAFNISSSAIEDIIG